MRKDLVKNIISRSTEQYEYILNYTVVLMYALHYSNAKLKLKLKKYSLPSRSLFFLWYMEAKNKYSNGF